MISTLKQKKKQKKIVLKKKTKPQLKGWVLKVRTQTPRKPNSALRKVVKIQISKKKALVAYIPGIGHNLKKHATVLVRGGGARDLPGVKHSCVRGVHDLAAVQNRFKRRSLYGIKKK